MAAKPSWFTRLFSRGGGPTAPAPAVWESGQHILDDFEVERPLGQGGMGTVYLLRSRSTGERFAVKRTLLPDAASRRNFLAELQTWIDLPEHPHLAACRFFRTVGDEVVIFAEFMDEGSLAGWIRDGRLSHLETALDVAIQFAWGLHAAHEAGVVHQDVKPANALLDSAGFVKVTDFGLARARARAGRSGPAGETALVSGGGMTPAYCSPEQADGLPLSRRTDVWSWGVSVLEMFTGGVTWASGVAAAEVLEELIAAGPAEPALPPLPPALADVLRRCFRPNPAERWADLAAAADALEEIYRQATGRPYGRGRPADAATAPPAAPATGRAADAAEKQGPRALLVLALRAAGRDPAEAEAFLATRADSPRAQAVADLAAYEESRRILEALLAAGRADLAPPLAGVCFRKALTHVRAGDLPGALAMYGRAADLLEPLVRAGAEAELGDALAKTYLNRASLLADQGDPAAALDPSDKGLALLERLVRSGQGDLADDLARAYSLRGNLVLKLGNARAAVTLYDQALAVYERLGAGGRHEGWVHALLNKANVLQRLGDPAAAAALYRQGVAALEQLVLHEGRRDLEDDLAGACANSATLATVRGDLAAAGELADRALTVRERLVHREGRFELAAGLAVTYVIRAEVHTDGKEYRRAVEAYDRAVAVWNRLVRQEGRRDLAGDLARAYLGKARVLEVLKEPFAAATACEQAIDLYEPLVHREGRCDLAGDLARAYQAKAEAAGRCGDRRAAGALFDLAIALRERLVTQEGQRDLVPDLARTYLAKGAAIAEAGDRRGAAPLFARASTLLGPLVHGEGRHELAGELALAYLLQGRALAEAGDARPALQSLNCALVLYERLVHREGRRDLADLLTLAATLKAGLRHP